MSSEVVGFARNLAIVGVMIGGLEIVGVSPSALVEPFLVSIEAVGFLISEGGPLAIGVLWLGAVMAYLVIRVEAGTEPVAETNDESGRDVSGETITLGTADGGSVPFDAETLDPQRVRVGDRYAWLAEHEDEPVEIADPREIPLDPKERARELYLDGEIDEDELARRLDHDLSVELGVDASR